MGILRNAAITASISVSTVSLILGTTTASAREVERHVYHLPAQTLADSLRAVAIASSRSIVAPAELVDGKRAPAIEGDFTPEEAVAKLLIGSGLRQRAVGGGLIIERATPSAEHGTLGATDDPEIFVTGSRIRGAPVASPVISITGEAIRDAGQSNLGEVARSLPQSFGGGQNPGVGFNVPTGSGGNIGGGSSVNLRGLGSDATLTLLNGRRLPYSASRQGIDISAIPLAAVDRLEVVADGASALYGSDAVAGVVNVILKHDFDGLETRALLGGSTDGGNFQQQYGAIAGHRWDTGGAFATYEYADGSAILAKDRDYASARPGVTLMPGSRRHAVAASGHQRLGDNLSVEFDALYNHRSSATTYPLNFAGDLRLSRTTQSFTAETFALAGNIDWSLGDWRLSLTGSHGKDRTVFRGDTFTNDTLTGRSGGRYDNRSTMGEIGADGPLFNLPGGDAKLAVGAGIRDNGFRLFRGIGAVQNIDASQDSLYAFGELSLPLLAPEQAIGLVHRLSLSAAMRYEHYRGLADVVTPKLGILYAPSADLDFKASWGKSFRAPTFIQLHQVQQAALYPARVAGGTGYPSGSTALLLFGGNPALKPEKATSWSATLALHPGALPGATLELSYFSTRYVDRIVNPIPLIAQALSNSIYQDQIILHPTPAQQAVIIAGASQFINGTGGAYDPARVVAIVNSANVNAGRQSIHGVDALFNYRTDIARGSLGISFNASYLDSEQQISAAQPVQQLAGVVFNPPHFRGRAMMSWQNGPLTLAATVSYTGGISDPRTMPAVRIRGMTSADLTARYRFDSGQGLLRDLEVALSIQNMFNETPANIATTLFYDTPYDSTNYSPVGRFISFGISKKW